MTKSDIPVTAIEKLVYYLWEDELEHYAGGPDHIFLSMKEVAGWLSTNPAATCDWRSIIEEADAFIRSQIMTDA